MLHELFDLKIGSDPDVMWSQLETLRPIYDKSKKRVDGEDPDWEERKKFLIDKIAFLINSFQETDSSTKAVLIIGQAQALASEMRAPQMNVAQFETLKKHYDKVTSRRQ